MTLWSFSRRTFVCRYCIIVSFLVYVASIGVFLPLLSSTPKTRQDLVDPVAVSEPLLATRNHLVPVSLPAAAAALGDGRRPPDAAASAAFSTPTTKKLTPLEVLHKNMTLHKANMSDILKHVKAAVAVANHSDDDDSLSNRKVVNPHPFHYIINCPNMCSNRDVYIIAYIHTAPDHYKRRVVIRQTWGDASYYDVGIYVVFVMGQKAGGGGDVQRALEFEAAQYGDIVQEDFIDTYHNLTYKGVAALRWISRYCSHARYVLKTDDDIFVNTFNLLYHLRRFDRAAGTASPGAPAAAPRALLLCMVWYNMIVMREGKWKVGKDEWPEDRYPTYCSGSAFLMSTDVAIAMHRISYDVRFFWVDDFYVTGLLPLKLGPSVVMHTQFISVYVLNGRQLEEKFTGPQWYQYVFSHVQNLNAIQTVWKTVVRLARGELVPTIPYALPGQLPVTTPLPPSKSNTKKPR